VTAWWKKAQDRDSWKAVIKEAKAHKGPPDKKKIMNAMMFDDRDSKRL
jgi:hypothetical protein